MINAPAPTRASSPIDALDLDRLESLLTDLESEHQSLLDLAGQQRDAITRADTKDLSKVIEQTTQTLTRIAHIERSRQQTIKLPDGSIPTVTQITSHLSTHPEHHTHATTLNNRAKSLRSLMTQLKEEHEAVRLASQALSNHMAGLMEQVSAKLSHTGTYSRTGSIHTNRNQVVSSLDTTH